MQQWNDDQPIYRQLRDRMVGLIMEGAYLEGDAIPSVRAVSSEYQINHLTVSKAYQELVDEGLVEKRRGLGMFVIEGAREHISKAEREKFLSIELPQLLQRIAQLGISKKELVEHINTALEGAE
ncbi:GntR family transcriptional regulator [Simiduia curdlanivorans]|uniref:GntR family transcriptional regulator n=1 Tax=Simiduia curdlanivorans TaxID=1492769 RepID=A0ABV8V611_9GAMM|nr:GntR family transcriptional regulator [Simiduia curdlanivorans]MDN3640556.1 GntR family transcriptional regulator [Simiduia curdlanivorans]